MTKTTATTRRTVVWEWAVESDDGEDCQSFDSLTDALRHLDATPDSVLVLVRSVGSEAEGLADRSYAYASGGGEIPTHTDDGSTVPARLRAAYAAATIN